jgi:hypothetical protein
MNKEEALEYLKNERSLSEWEKHLRDLYKKLELNSDNQDELKKEILIIFKQINDDVYKIYEFEEMYLSMILNIIHFDKLEIEPNNLARDYQTKLEIVKQFCNNLDELSMPKPLSYHYEVLIGIYGESKAKIIIKSITNFMYGNSFVPSRKSNFAKEWQCLIQNFKLNM